MVDSAIKKIDLHMHTNVSDGTDSPCEIVEKVKEAGIDLFAVTDHDSYSGCNQIIEYIKENNVDIRYLSGVEFSCQDDYGKYHILGYGFDVNAVDILDVIKLSHDNRIRKTYDRLDFLKTEYGFIFSSEDIDELMKNKNPGKPHIGNMMVKLGYAPSKDEAINQYINNCPNKDYYIKPEIAIDAINKSGGISVLAHPSYGNGGQLILGDDMEKRIVRLKEMGIKGMEAYYSGFTKKLENEILELANKYNLYVTAGSDYHGNNKLVVLGDNNLDNIKNADSNLIRFLEDIADRIICN